MTPEEQKELNELGGGEMKPRLKIGDLVKVYTLPFSFIGRIMAVNGKSVFVIEEGCYSAHKDSPFHKKQCRKVKEK